jgi:hypothetical protein
MFKTKMAVPLLLGSHFDHVILLGLPINISFFPFYDVASEFNITAPSFGIYYQPKRQWYLINLITKWHKLEQDTNDSQ